MNFEGCYFLQSRGESQETRRVPKMLPSKKPAEVLGRVWSVTGFCVLFLECGGNRRDLRIGSANVG